MFAAGRTKIGKFKKWNVKRVVQQKEKVMLIGTWNVKGISGEGTVRNLNEKISKYKMELIVLPETHFRDKWEQEVNRHILFKSRNQKKNFGTGFIVGLNLKEKMMITRSRNSRIRSRGLDNTLVIKFKQEPTEDKKKHFKNKFYEKIDKIMHKIPIMILLELANAKVGREDMYREVIEGYSKHEEPIYNGLRLIKQAIQKNMKIMCIHFKRQA